MLEDRATYYLVGLREMYRGVKELQQGIAGLNS
jgi:hypothetical protein